MSNFPYLTSSTTYQAIILPANYEIGTFTKTPQTTGAFMLTNYTPGVGATLRALRGLVGRHGAARRRRRHLLHGRRGRDRRRAAQRVRST